MKRYKGIVTKTSSALLLILLLTLTASAQTSSPVTISLVADKASYQSGEPIKMQVVVMNETGQNVITRKGFFDQDFHLKITFTDPDGKIINSKYQPAMGEGGPPYRYQDKDAVLAEVVPPKDPTNPATIRTVVIDDARTFYDLTRYGRWTAQVIVAYESFSASTTDSSTGNLLAFLENRESGPGFAASNKTSFEIVSPTPVVKSSIRVFVNDLKIGTGTKPPTTKTPLENVQVNLYRSSAIPAYYKPVNFKTYPIIWDNLDPVKTSYTNSKGIATFDGIEKENYVVIALYNKSQDFRHMGTQVEAGDPAWNSSQPVEAYLMVMEKANAKSNPGKTTKQTGSLLLITEPEYVEWDSNKELYPIVFESVGDWTVTAVIMPPEGFITDYSSLNAVVKNETEAVQFTVTDVGSRWVETNVSYTITHKKKSKTIKDEVGIKLSRRLAVRKGVGIYGNTDIPGSFMGGKKISQ